MISCVEFAERHYGLALTVGQRALVAVAIDRVPIDELPALERDAALAMLGDLSSAPPVAWRTVVAACGRDSGKTEIGACVALYKLLTVDVSTCGPGDIPRGFVVAPDLDTAALTVERAVARVQESPALRALLVGDAGKNGFKMRRPDGRVVRFEVRSASRGGRSIRGRSIVVLVLDEAAFFTSDGFVINDAEIVRAARPRILRDGLVLMLSTLWMDEGLFYELFTRNREIAQTAIVACAPSLVMRDHDPDLAARIELEREEDPDNAAREYDCVSVAAGSSIFFDPTLLLNAVRPIEPSLFTTRAAGADIGLIRDSSAVCIVGRCENAVQPKAFEIALLEHEEYRPTKGQPLKLSLVVGAFAAVMRRHGVREVTADGHAREPAREHAADQEITIASAPEGNEGKWQSYLLVRQLLLEGRLLLPKEPRLLAQLRAVRSKPLPGGGYQLSTPRRTGGGHGDICSAFVAAVWAGKATSYFVALGQLEEVMTGRKKAPRPLSKRETKERQEMRDRIRMTRMPAEAAIAIADLEAKWRREDLGDA